MMTEAMRERTRLCGVQWEDTADGYSLGQGHGMFPVSCIALPEDHPCIGLDYDLLHPNVNGGLTFSDDNVFGWDYGHASNVRNFDDFDEALDFFRCREVP